MSKIVRPLPRDYTAEEMDRGEGMQFHPTVGEPNTELSSLDYDEGQRCYVERLGPESKFTHSAIGDGQAHRKGDPYPHHWAFDPWLGDHLGGVPWLANKVFTRDFSAEELDRGDGMNFHPDWRNPRKGDAFLFIYGKTIEECRFDPETSTFVARYPHGQIHIQLERIGDGKPQKVGDPYPKHWYFDPWTGEGSRPFCWPA